MALTAISPSPPSTNNNGNSPSVTSSDVVDVDYYRKGVKYLIDNSKDMKILPPEFVLPLPEAERPSLAICGSIPVIDLSGLNGTVEQRLSTIHAISSACAEWGFFRVSNHGIKISVMDEMLKAVEEFFNLPLEEKMRYASEDVMDPVRYGTSLNTSRKHTLHWRDFLRHYGGPVPHSYDLWPDNPPCYRRIAKDYLEEVWQLAIKIFGAISGGLGVDTKYIERSLGEGTQIIAANFYPPCPEPNKTLGLAAHSDHGGLTVLMDNGINGLQIKHNQTWLSVPHIPGTFVVNLGDYLEILSNGRYKSVEHRAVVNAERTRISVAVGHGPEMTAIVQPAGPLLKENSESKYRPIIYKEYIRGQQSTTKRGKSALHEIVTSSHSK
ncbi:protein DOWNY MILDEW RESISTANCE 6-like [Nicotiana sylvestris]|uniref:Flavonol synthase/flavanone 3-hydroxylase-like n=1 Tax=Nicotiana sylvestris TaxID=4096 RepID=A0A1U7XE81_NICSY|nr:PREDICTED: flavonol synthase/flavanone 3-hydroxylase-like [Nicotiana sylvestris]XP_016449353.1 PREDICTED: protein DOWNY MILDEW RESISTANCE 6-like [Nicotiana tabacum]